MVGLHFKLIFYPRLGQEEGRLGRGLYRRDGRWMGLMFLLHARAGRMQEAPGSVQRG